MATRDARVINAECRLTTRDLDAILTNYRVPSYIELFLPSSRQRVNNSDSKRLALHEEPLRIDIHFPFEGLMTNFLRTFNIAPGQMTPNSWWVVRELELWARGTKVKLSGKCLLHLLTIKWSGEFLAVQGLDNTKVISGMPSSNKNWKPHFFFTRQIDREGATGIWDVPIKWRDNLAVPDPPQLSTEERHALRAFWEATKTGGLAYTHPATVCQEREAGRKRLREDVQDPIEDPLAAIPLRPPLPKPLREKLQGVQIGGARRRRIVKKAYQGCSSEEQEL